MLKSLVSALLGMAFAASTCLAQFDSRREQPNPLARRNVDTQPLESLSGSVTPVGKSTDDSLASFVDKSWAVKPAYEIVADREILTALERKVTVEFKETPLKEVIAQFRRHLQINLRLDEAKLTDEGVQVEQPITFAFTDVAAASALSHLLKPLQLAWTIRGEALIITTTSEAVDLLETRVYPVRDLVTVRDSTGTWEDYQSLINVIIPTIVPDSWDTVGGESTVTEFEPSGVLVIRQTQSAHREITSLLDQLRKARGLSTVPVRRRFTNATAFFDVPTETRRERSVTDPPTWRVPQAYR